jgi:hypothetical protein
LDITLLCPAILLCIENAVKRDDDDTKENANVSKNMKVLEGSDLSHVAKE